MCEASPGIRCPDDTCDKAEATANTYSSTHPKGPQVGALERVRHVRVKADAPLPENTYRVLPSRFEEAKERIEAANRKLERAGIEDRFTISARPVLVETTRTDGPRKWMELDERIEITVNYPSISFGGWTFVAAIDSTEAGLVTRVAPGQSLDGWRPDEVRCDHCNQKRHRSKTYIVRAQDGTIRQVGSGCLRPFMGITPGALWALEYEPDIKEGHDPQAAEHTWGEGRVVDTREAIALALAVSDGGRDYLSRTRAEVLERPATADRVVGALEPPRSSESAKGWEALRAKAQTYIDDGTVDEVINTGRTLDGDGDYASNMRVIMANDHLDYRHLGMAVSAVGAWHRGKQRQAQRASIAKGYVAEVGEKIAGTKATVTMVKYLDNPYQRNGVRTLALFQSESGHVIKWMASGRKDLKVGQVGQFAGGTVKAHDEYNGVDQTVVTRAKFE